MQLQGNSLSEQAWWTFYCISRIFLQFCLMSLREWKNANNSGLEKLTSSMETDFFSFKNLFIYLAGKKSLGKHSSRLTRRFPELYRPSPRTAQWFRKPVKKACYPPDGFAQIISHCHGWKGSTTSAGTRSTCTQRREESPPTPTASALALSSASASTSQDHLLALNPLPLRHSAHSLQTSLFITRSSYINRCFS